MERSLAGGPRRNPASWPGRATMTGRTTTGPKSWSGTASQKLTPRWKESSAPLPLLASWHSSPQRRCLSATMNGSSKRSAAVMAPPDSLPGLGPKSTAMLAAVGVKSVTDLRRLGAAKAFLDVRAAGLRPSLNLLWALEGALTAMPWQKVARTERTRLLFEVEDLKTISTGGNRSGSNNPKPL